MAHNKIIKFLVDDEQYRKIKNKASLKGHKTISSYLRELSLEKDLQYENMFLKMYNKIMEISNGI